MSVSLEDLKMLYLDELPNADFPDAPGTWLILPSGYQSKLTITRVFFEDGVPVFVNEGKITPISRTYGTQWIHCFGGKVLQNPPGWRFRYGYNHTLSFTRSDDGDYWIHPEFRTLVNFFGEILIHGYGQFSRPDDIPHFLGIVSFSSIRPSGGNSWAYTKDGERTSPYPVGGDDDKWAVNPVGSNLESFDEIAAAILEAFKTSGQRAEKYGLIPYDGGPIHEYYLYSNGKPTVFETLDEWEASKNDGSYTVSSTFNDELVDQTFYNSWGFPETKELYDAGQNWERDFVQRWIKPLE
jgi:hypothetical protein